MAAEQIKSLIDARESTHGDFRDNAFIAQEIKRVVRSAPNWDLLTRQQKESLDLIATKIGRIMAGNPHIADHWTDIGGYSQLVANDLR